MSTDEEPTSTESVRRRRTRGNATERMDTTVRSKKEDSDNVAEKILGAVQRAKRSSVESSIDEDEKKYQYFYRCPRCNGHGIYFTGRPSGGKLTDERWFATYKKPDEPWADEQIWCQECLAKGRETHLPVMRDRSDRRQAHRLGHPFRVDQRDRRFLCKFPRDPEEFKRTPILRSVPAGSGTGITSDIVYPKEKSNG